MRLAITTLLLSVSCLFGQPESVLRPGDTVTLVFSIKEDDLDGTYSVSRDGYLNLPFVGKVSVEGIPLNDVRDVIRKKYIDGQIYTRLSVAAFKNPIKFISIPNPSGEGTIRVIAPEPGKPVGDFFSPEEKKKLFKIDQLDARQK
jgi:protein involved in polysaccharide export with SLBB domain